MFKKQVTQLFYTFSYTLCILHRVILSTLEISDHLQQSANPRIALQLFIYGSTEYYLRLGLMMPFKVFPSLIFICPTSAHCKHTVIHPSSGVLVKIKAQISGKQTPHLRPVTHANNTAKHNIQCAHTDTHTALTDWWLFRDFMHQKEYNLFQTHMRKCSCSGGLVCIDPSCLFIRAST